MKKLVKSTIVVFIAIMILTVSTVVNAETGENYSVRMSLTSNSKLNAGDTVTVSVNLTSVNAGNGIDTITAELNYDTNVFEEISSSNFTASNGWKTPSYAASSKMLTVQKDSKVKSAETIFTISLKAKNPINTNSTTISLKEITASGGRITDGGTGDITVNNTSVTINKNQNATSNTENPTNNGNTNSGNTNSGNTNTGSTNTGNTNTGSTTTGSTTTNNTTSGNTVTSNTTADNTNKTTILKDSTATKDTSLPKAGLEQHKIILISVILIAGMFSYALYKRISKDVK